MKAIALDFSKAFDIEFLIDDFYVNLTMMKFLALFYSGCSSFKIDNSN